MEKKWMPSVRVILAGWQSIAANYAAHYFFVLGSGSQVSFGLT